MTARMKAALWIAAALAATDASAHIPDECRPLFEAAARATDGVVRKGNEANDVVMNALDNYRSIGVEDYMTLADRLAQLLGWQGDMFIKLTEAIECVDREH